MEMQRSNQKGLLYWYSMRIGYNDWVRRIPSYNSNKITLESIVSIILGGGQQLLFIKLTPC